MFIVTSYMISFFHKTLYEKKALDVFFHVVYSKSVRLNP
jgi:hypothetical protein